MLLKTDSRTAKKTYNYSAMLKFKSHFMKNPDVIEKKCLQIRNHDTQIDIEVTNLPRKKIMSTSINSLFDNFVTASNPVVLKCGWWKMVVLRTLS